MKKIVAKFEIVTPMFLAGAEQSNAELRVSSIKAELLFWWRALNYAKYVKNGSNDHKAALTGMHKDEVLIFGGPGIKRKGKLTGGQGKFLLMLDDEHSFDQKVFRELNSNIGLGGNYLAYGLKGDNKNPERGYLDIGAFEIKLLFRGSTNQQLRHKNTSQLESILDALKLMGLLGGLGSRKRRGWGSLRLNELIFDNMPNAGFERAETVDEYKAQVKSLLNPTFAVDGTEFPLTAFGGRSTLKIWKSKFSSALKGLEALGMEFLTYRSWGNNGLVDGKPSQKNFELDHHWFKNAFSDDLHKSHTYKKWNTGASNIPERANFGLPHNYFKYFRSDDKKTENDLKLGVNLAPPFERRASPLMFHMVKIGSQEFYPVATYFNNAFFPEKGTRLHRKQGNKDFDFAPNPDVIKDFLDGNSRSRNGSNTNSKGSDNKPFLTKVF